MLIIALRAQSPCFPLFSQKETLILRSMSPAHRPPAEAPLQHPAFSSHLLLSNKNSKKDTHTPNGRWMTNPLSQPSLQQPKYFIFLNHSNCNFRLFLFFEKLISTKFELLKFFKKNVNNF